MVTLWVVLKDDATVAQLVEMTAGPTDTSTDIQWAALMAVETVEPLVDLMAATRVDTWVVNCDDYSAFVNCGL
jgi:hypothetical protein